jgi:hypothetical protein
MAIMELVYLQLSNVSNHNPLYPISNDSHTYLFFFHSNVLISNFFISSLNIIFVQLMVLINLLIPSLHPILLHIFSSSHLWILNVEKFILIYLFIYQIYFNNSTKFTFFSSIHFYHYLLNFNIYHQLITIFYLFIIFCFIHYFIKNA